MTAEASDQNSGPAFEEEGAVYRPGEGEAADGKAAPETGLAVIQAHLKTLPDSPGVYRMLDAEGAVLRTEGAERRTTVKSAGGDLWINLH